MNNLPTAVWFTIVTMTTVGYGDYTPMSVAGYVVASMCIIVSALYMSVPIGIVGNAFSQVWGDRDRLLVTKRFRAAFLQGGYTWQVFEDIFSMFDEDDNGTLDIDEFGCMLRTIQMNMSEDRVSLLYQALDKDGVGHITLEALVNGLAPKAFAREIFQQGVKSSSLSLIPSSIIQSLPLQSTKGKASESV
jgi:hypothetical protein